MTEEVQLIVRLMFFGMLGFFCSKKDIANLILISMLLMATYLHEIIYLLRKISCQT